MIKKIFLASIIFMVFFRFSFAEDSLKIKPKVITPKETRNNWSLNFIYTDKGFGLGANLYKRVTTDMDLVGGIMVTGLKDPNENEQFDIYGNSYVFGKENRVFTIPVSIGLQNYLFSNTLDESFKPFISVGVTPTLVLSNPYDKNFFKALGYLNSAFALGGYAGIGLEYRESMSTSFCVNLRYSYVPVLINEVRSLKDRTITDVGGVTIMIGVNFLK
ncbi:MAG TPA: hypothetical protein VIK14_06855 [Ignavibacteria bacterium]